MILLEIFNRGVKEYLLTKFAAAKSGTKIDKMKVVLADFDGTVYKISNDEDRNIIKVSINLRFYQQLQEYGTDQILKREYGNRFCNKSEPGYNVTIVYDVNQLEDDVESLAHNAALLKRNCFASVFESFFKHQESGDVDGLKDAVVKYRDDETMYVRAMADRVTVVFSTIFKDSDDVIIGKVFIQELTEARRRVERAPQVLYSAREPPAELRGTNAVTGDNVAYITFVLFSRHIATPEARKTTIDLIHTFRNYLHYHIKCSKAHIHMRMRAKSAEFLKILKRAQPTISTTDTGAEAIDFKGAVDLGVEGLNLGIVEKKVMGGKSFRPAN